MKASCETCRFWNPVVSNVEYDGPELSFSYGAAGECRRRAPVHRQFDADGVRRLWAETSAIEWCGEWEAR